MRPGLQPRCPRTRSRSRKRFGWQASATARGLISAPLSGELLAAWICGEPLPLPRAVAEACHPNRFLLRDLVRGQRG